MFAECVYSSQFQCSFQRTHNDFVPVTLYSNTVFVIKLTFFSFTYCFFNIEKLQFSGQSSSLDFVVRCCVLNCSSYLSADPWGGIRV